MPTIIEQFPEPRYDSYPEEWFDGQVRVFVRHYDYECTPKEFAGRLRQAGWRRGYQIRVAVDKSTDKVTAQVTGKRPLAEG